MTRSPSRLLHPRGASVLRRALRVRQERRVCSSRRLRKRSRRSQTPRDARESPHERHRPHLRAAGGAHPAAPAGAPQRDDPRDVARLARVCAAIAARADALVVVVEGAGGHFCAGADISGVRHRLSRRRGDARLQPGDPERLKRARRARPADDRRARAASAIGGGLALALCCDLRFCADDAHLAITPARLGLLYGLVETRRLVEPSARRAPRTCCSAAGASRAARRWRSA